MPLAWAAIAAAVLGGCAQPARQGPAATPARADSDSATLAWPQRQRERARRLEADDPGQWPAALLIWDALARLPPGDSLAAGEHARLAQRMAATADQLLHQARQAQARGDLDGAERHYALLLVLQPAHETARQSLRQLDLQRLRRGTQAPRAIPATSTAASASPGAGGRDATRPAAGTLR